MALNVGELFGSLSWQHDKKGADEFDRRYDEAQAKARKKIEAQLGAAVDAKAFAKYHESLDRAERRAKQKEAFKVALGADFDPKGFAAFSRAANQAERDAHKAKAATKSFSDELNGLNVQVPRLGSVMGLLKWPAIIAGAGMAAQAVSAATAGVTALGSALAPLSGAIAAYPALGSAAAQGIGVWKLATDDVFKVVGNLNTQMDTQNKAFKKLSPEAQNFARTLNDLKKPLTDLPAVAQKGLLPGLEEGIKGASRNLGVVRPIIRDTAKEIGGLAAQAGKLVGSRAFGRDLQTQGERNVKWIGQGGTGALHLANALRNVTLAAGPLVDWMVRGAVHGTKLVDSFTAQARESGKLAGFFEETRVAIFRLVRIGGDLATAFWNIGKAGKPLGDDILVNLVKVADHFRRWAESARGQNAIARYFRDAHDPLFELGQLVHDIGVDFFKLGKGNQLAPMIRTIRVDLLPKFVELVDATTKSFGPPMLDAIKQVAILFTTLGGTNGPLTMLVKLVGKIAEGINKATDAVPGLGAAISSISTVASLYAALRIGASLSGLTRIIKLIKDVRKATAVTGAVEVATGGAAAGAAGGGAAAAATRGGVTAAVVSKLPIAAIGAAIAAAIAAAIPKTKAHRKLTDFFNFDSTKLDDQLSAVDRFNKALGRLNATGDKKGADKLADQFGRLKNAAHGLGSVRDIDKLTNSALDLAKAGGTLNREIGKALDQAGKHFADFRRTGSNNLHGIHVATQENMHFIKRTLGEDSAAGKEALARNFRLARTAIRQAMQDGRVSVKDGLAEIQRLMRAELKQYGITGGVATSIIKHGNIKPETPSNPGTGKARGGWVRRAVGGWIGRRGMVSDDIVPIGDGALAAFGEYVAQGPGGRAAVLNRHQAPVADMALAAGGYRSLDQGADLSTIERALAPLGGLDRLFSAITRPHYLAGGGRFAVGGVTPAISSLISELDSKGFHHGSTTQGRHAPNSYHYRGMAVDYGDASNDMQRLWSIVFPQRSRFAELFGPTRVNPGPHLMHNGAAFTDALLQAQHQDHIHMALAGGIGALGAGTASAPVWKDIKPPQVSGSGMLGAIVQATLDRATAAANQRGSQLVASAGPDLSGGPGGGSNSANKALGQKMAAAMGWTGAQFSALDKLWTGESNWSNTARNSSSGAFGIPQALPASKMGPAGAGGNPRAQIAWGLGYIKQRYGSPAAAYAAWLSRSPHWYGLGGMVQRLASGGRKKRKPLVAPRGPVTHAQQPRTLQTKSLAKLQTTRVADYDQLETEVQDLETAYGQQERFYNLTDEVLVDPDTGALNMDAIGQRAHEIQLLIDTRNTILRKRNQMRDVAERIVKTYQTIIKRLTDSLKYTKRGRAGTKQRGGIRAQIKQYQDDLTGTWAPNLRQIVKTDLPDTRLDLLELRGEKAAVLGTQATPQDPGAAGDTGGAADAGTAADTATAPPTALDIAAGVQAALEQYKAGQSDLIRNFGSNAVAQRAAFQPGGVLSGTPDLEGAALGALRGFGGGSNLAGSLGAGTGGPSVGQLVVNFASPPADGPTLVQQLRFQVENGGVG